MIESKIVKELIEALTRSEKKTSAYDTVAEVVRVEDDVAWVHIPGGVDETPVQMSVNSRVGDTVRVRVSGGQAWLMGNDTAPPTDDSAAIAAQETADSVEEYIGMHMKMTEDGLQISADGNNWKVIVKNDGVYVVDPSGRYASQFSSYAQLGVSEGSHSVIDQNGQRFYGSDGTTQLANIGYGETVSDLSVYIYPYYTFGTRKAGNIGSYSFAQGTNVLSADRNTHAEGGYTEAKAVEAHAEGYHSIASAKASHAEGYYTEASGNYSHAEGYETESVGIHSHAEGNGTNASGSHSHAEGEGSRAEGTDSHAEGKNTVASGDYSHAEGDNTVASGACSHAEGDHTVASGVYSPSHAEGYGTTASGNGSHAEGESTVASGDYSHAEGEDTVAAGYCSHAQNDSTNASGNNQTALGKYNVVDNASTYAVIIGNGTGDNARSNALAVKWNGDVVLAANATVDGVDVSELANDVATTNTSSTVSLTNNTDTTLCNTGSLSAGTYIINGQATFNEDTTGFRRLFLARSNTGSADNRFMRVTSAPASGSDTHMQIQYFVTLESATTFYLRARQTSGGALNVSQAGIQVLKIHA